MDQKPREKSERRDRDVQEAAKTSKQRTRRIDDLKDRLKRMFDGDADFWTSGTCPVEDQEVDLEDILAFESVGAGISLFEGLQEHGVNLPRPEELDEEQSRLKVEEVLQELARLRIFLVGFESMNGHEFYSILWHQTLWEGCYVEKRNPGALTIIDISHKMSRSELMKLMGDLQESGRVQ